MSKPACPVIRLPLPHVAQARMLAESRRYNVAVCGRRFGKTYLAADILLCGPRQKGALHGFPVALYADTHATMLESWKRFCHILKPVTRAKSEQHKRLDLITGGVVEMWSLDNPDAGRGRKYATVVLDEAAKIRRLQEAWDLNIQPLLMDYRGEAWIISTPKGDNHFKTLFDRGNPANPAREADWQSWQIPTWENPHIAEKEIESMRQSMPRLAFLQEIEAQFVTFAGTFVKAEHIRTGRPPDGMDLYQGVDLAISMKENADYTAVVTVGVDAEGRVWIVDAIRERVGFRDALALIERQAMKWRPKAVAVEVVQYQAAAVEELLRTTSLPIVKAKPDKDKLTRAQGLITRYENGLVWHSDTLPKYFADEILAFGPDCEHDDMVDAAVYAYAQTGDYGKSQILFPSGTGMHWQNQSPATPEGMVGAITQLAQEAMSGRCGSCTAFADGLCEERRFAVRPDDPACWQYLPNEE